MPRGIYKRTEEHNTKISHALKGHPMYKSASRSEKLRIIHLGKKASPETKIKMSIMRKGKKLTPMSEKGKLNLSKAHLGKKQPLMGVIKRAISNTGKRRTLETRLKMRASSKKGSDNHFWKGGVTKINEKIRKSFEYRLWRKAVYERDNHTCVWCGIKGTRLNADHIKPFALFPELRFAIDNGRALCEDCHKKTDTYGGKSR